MFFGFLIVRSLFYVTRKKERFGQNDKCFSTKLCFFSALPRNCFVELKLPVIYEFGKYRLSAVKVEYLLELKTYQKNFQIANNRLRRSDFRKKSEFTNFAAIFL
jgi:hypothetical protein